MKKYFYSIILFTFAFCANVAASAINEVKVLRSVQNTINCPKVLDNIYCVMNEETLIPIVVENSYSDDIKNIDVLFTIGENKISQTLNPASTEDKFSTFYAKFPVPSVSGCHEYSLSVEKINGMPNNSNSKTSKGNVIALTRKVPHKVVFEEFTGIGCGWCPRGIVGTQKAMQVYGDNVIVVAVHDGPLQCRDYNHVSAYVEAKPNAHIDRTIKFIDPYFGSLNDGTHFGISRDIDKMAAIDPVAEVKVSASIEGDTLTAVSDIKFLFTGKTNHAVAFVITEDGVHNEKWRQTNNYANFKGQGLDEIEPLFSFWVNGEKSIPDVHYNEVAMAAQGAEKGIEGSIPEEVKEEESNTYEVKFDLSNIKKIQNRKNLNVCAFLFDTNTGSIVNADRMSFEHETAIEGVESDDTEVVETARYTIDGRRIYSSEKGVNIVKYSDGSVKKIVVE